MNALAKILFIIVIAVLVGNLMHEEANQNPSTRSITSEKDYRSTGSILCISTCKKH